MTTPSTQSTCPDCGHLLMMDALFCHHCGQQMQASCYKCGTRNPQDSTFCHRCGTRLTRSPAAANSVPGPANGAGTAAPSASHAPSSSYPMYTPPPDTQQRTACLRCHSVNDAGARFCYSCGLPFEGPLPSVVASGALQDAVGSVIGIPAGFWIRLGATIVDLLLLTIGTQIILSVLGLNYEWPAMPDASTLQMEDLLRYFQNGLTAYPLSAENILSSGIDAAYCIIGWSVFRTTVGKRLFGLYVVRPDGRNPTPLRSLGRWLMREFDTNITLGIGHLLIVFRKDKRALHDLIADTYVVKR